MREARQNGVRGVWGNMEQAVHFVGFRHDREYLSAVMVWGKPDFIHRVHDRRMRREIADGDTVVFGSRARPDIVNRYNGDDIREEITTPL